MSRDVDALPVLAASALFPVDEENRYGIYSWLPGPRELRLLATCPDPGGIGLALVTLDEDAASVGRRLIDEGAIGIRDRIEARWLCMPWHRGEGR